MCCWFCSVGLMLKKEGNICESKSAAWFLQLGTDAKGAPSAMNIVLYVA